VVAALSFSNFDLEIGPERAGAYPLSVLRSPAGETTEPVWQSITSGDALTQRLALLDAGMITAPDLLILGRLLAQHLLPAGPIQTLYQRSLGAIAARGKRLRLRLRIQPPELAAWPWEYAYDDDITDFFALNPLTVMTRYWDHPIAARPIPVYAPVSVLVVACSPSGYPPLSVASEIHLLLDGLREPLEDGRAKVGILITAEPDKQAEIDDLVTSRQGVRRLPGQAGLTGLRDALRQGYRLLHIIAHGMADTSLDDVLLLADEEGQGTAVTAQALARELRGSSAAVIVLNACKSAIGGSGRAFAGLAPSLLTAGLPAVLAMQYNITDAGAVRFAREVYGALAAGWPLDAAVAEGRRAISAENWPTGSEFGIPALFMRSPNGMIWRVPAPRRRQHPATLPPASGRAGVHITGTTHIRGDIIGGNKIMIGSNEDEQED
jgi:hypothetical protein